MGSIYRVKCTKCKKAENATFGFGFKYQDLCDETMQKMKDGEFGEKYAKIIKDNPDSIINCDSVVFVCKECNKWFTDIAMNIHKKDIYGYLELGKMIKKFERTCKNCGSKKLIMLAYFDDNIMKCNNCGGKLKETNHIMWD